MQQSLRSSHGDRHGLQVVGSGVGSVLDRQLNEGAELGLGVCEGTKLGRIVLGASEGAELGINALEEGSTEGDSEGTSDETPYFIIMSATKVPSISLPSYAR